MPAKIYQDRTIRSASILCIHSSMVKRFPTWPQAYSLIHWRQIQTQYCNRLHGVHTESVHDYCYFKIDQMIPQLKGILLKLLWYCN